MTRCPGWDATCLPFRLGTVHDRLTPSPPHLGSDPLREGLMASSALVTGLAIALRLGLLPVAPLDALARGSGGRASGYSSRSYSSRHTHRSPAASRRGPTKCWTCERDSHGQIKRGPTPPAPLGRIPQHLSLQARMQRRLATRRGQALYARGNSRLPARPPMNAQPAGGMTERRHHC